MSRSHPQCVNGHICQEPSGKSCFECGQPAGTWWGPHFCPDCDKERLDRIDKNLNEIAKAARGE